ncbi:MAG TPA: ABC transporter permease [Ilumatobacter sp.]|nr:ABC transporter permease [Ilumatobacter sp.]
MKSSHGHSRGGRTRRANLGERLVLLGPGGLYLAAFFVVPLVLVVGYAFLTPSRFGGATAPVSFDSISRLAEPVYRRVIATSVVLALAATVFALLIGYPAALAIARLPRRWRTIALVAVVLPFWTNFLIRMYAWIVLLNNEGLINRILRGLSVTDEPIALMNNRPAIVLGLVYAYLPLMILPLYSAIERLDPQLGEAATNLGASAVTRFRTITLPLTTQGALTGALFVFVPSLANFIVPELLGGGKTATIGTLARDQYLETRNWPFGSSVTLVVLVIVGLIVAAQSRFARRYGANA